MSKCCPVTYRGAIVGYLTITNEGLYRHYDGVFTFDGKGISRLYGITPAGRINLGVCRPVDGKWYIQGKIAAKRFDFNDTKFTINSMDEVVMRIPFSENAAFDYLDQLDRCRLSAGIDGMELIIHGENCLNRVSDRKDKVVPGKE